MPWALRRLNQDATWWVDLDGEAVIFDPWLVGSETDFAPWFNRQWHTGPLVAPTDVPPHALVVLSQGYADHLHPETLAALPHGAPVAAVPQAAGPGRLPIPPWGAPPLVHGRLRLWRLSRPWWRPPRYHAIVVADTSDRAVIHAPHGLPAAAAATIAAVFAVELLAITRAGFYLPWFLGGRVNPGPDAADAAGRACRARRLLAIHDEAKRGQGVVGHLGRVERRPPAPELPWIEVEHTGVVAL